MQAAYERSVKFFLVVGCGVATVFVTSATLLITLLLGPKYRAASPAMQILGMAFVPFFASNPFPLLLTALHEQRFLLWATIISLALRVALNFALIPPLGFIGPSFSFLAGEIVFLGLMVARLRQIDHPLALFEIAWRPLLASGAMALILLAARGSSLFWFLPAVIVASIVYVALIFRLGTFSPRELELAREGMGFIKPLIASWSNRPQEKTL